MSYKDLSNYVYYDAVTFPKVKNVGWLDNEHEFQVGKVGAEIIDTLKCLICNDELYNAKANVMRGIHPCPFCKSTDIYVEHEGKKALLGNAELWIPNGKDEFLVAPTLIVHYIEVHEYAPPSIFIDALKQLDLAVRFNAQEVYDRHAEEFYDA